MEHKYIKWQHLIGVLLLLPMVSFAWVKGIYISQTTLEDTQKLTYLMKRAKSVGIDTFVIDFIKMSKRYRTNIELVHQHGLRYVARIVMFPDGAHAWQVEAPNYWQQRFELAQQAISLGAKEIQLDYIRYKASQPPSSNNAKNILRIIKWFKTKLAVQKVPLQIDVFGIATFGESKYIGQNLALFANSVDAMNPMVYPSHFEPYLKHAQQPYETILTSLKALRKQVNGPLPFKLYPFIEVYNFRYPISDEARLQYIHAEIRAAQDAGADGWYAWSANNKYDKLFATLEQYKVH